MSCPEENFTAANVQHWWLTITRRRRIVLSDWRPSIVPNLALPWPSMSVTPNEWLALFSLPRNEFVNHRGSRGSMDDDLVNLMTLKDTRVAQIGAYLGQQLRCLFALINLLFSFSNGPLPLLITAVPWWSDCRIKLLMKITRWFLCQNGVKCANRIPHKWILFPSILLSDSTRDSSRSSWQTKKSKVSAALIFTTRQDKHLEYFRTCP